MNEPISEADYSKFDSLECRESKKVWQYFGQRAQGIFVDVGANHPTEQSQTWFLELKGWSGVLIEPNSRLCQLLRAQRPASKTVQAACCAPEQVGEADLHIGSSDAHSAINPQFDHALKGESERVKMRTLDSILAEAGISTVDFLSVDVEGMEIDVLKGCTLPKFQPRLMLIEDHLYDHRTHHYLRQQGYKLVRRTGYNNWYVPLFVPVSVFTLSTPSELIRLFRKMWLSPPFNSFRRYLRRRKFTRKF